MDCFKFSISENELVAMPSGALWWPAQSILCVSDLHFGKSNRLARMGQSWIPPYENQDTLLRLETDLHYTSAKKIIALEIVLTIMKQVNHYHQMSFFGLQKCKQVENGFGFLVIMIHPLKIWVVAF